MPTPINKKMIQETPSYPHAGTTCALKRQALHQSRSRLSESGRKWGQPRHQYAVGRAWIWRVDTDLQEVDRRPGFHITTCRLRHPTAGHALAPNDFSPPDKQYPNAGFKPKTCQADNPCPTSPPSSNPSRTSCAKTLASMETPSASANSPGCCFSKCSTRSKKSWN